MGFGDLGASLFGNKTGSNQKDQQHLHCLPVLGEKAAPWDMPPSALGISLEGQGTEEPPLVEYIHEKQMENHSLTPLAAEQGIFSTLLR